MYHLQKSRLFKRQVQSFAKSYALDVNAGKAVALRFVDEVEATTKFIAKNPLACSIYHDAKTHDQLKLYEFRKWRVKNFPHSLFFRIDGDTIILEAIYAHKMDITGRFPSEFSS